MHTREDTDVAVTGEWLLDGLHCPDCAARVEKAVSNIPGVVRATVSFPSGRLRVTYRLGDADPESVLAKVADLGYRAKGQGSRARPRASQDHDHSHDHSHGHAHDHPHEHGGAVWAPLTGAFGIAVGLTARHQGAAWYWVPLVIAAIVAGFPVAAAGFRTLRRDRGAVFGRIRRGSCRSHSLLGGRVPGGKGQ